MSMSYSFSVLLSGSSAGECILWDLHTMTMVRQIELPEMSPIQDVAIDDHSGNLLVCSQAAITLMSPNGEVLARGTPRQSGRHGDAVTTCTISPVR